MRTPPAKIEEVRLPWLNKIGFGLSGIGRMIGSVLVTTYLFYFYTEVLYLNAGAATTLTLVGRIWSWFVDPTMGMVIDCAHGKKDGKTRHILKVWSLPVAVAMILAFAVPNVATPIQAVWVFVTYIVFQTLDSLVKVALNTLMGRLTTDKVQRTNLNQTLTICSTATSLIFTSETLNIVNTLGGGDMRRGFALTAVAYGVVMVVVYAIAFFATAGYEPVEEVQTLSQKGPGILEILKAMSKNKVWILAILIYVFNTAGSMMQAQTMVAYFTHNLGDPQNYLRIYSTASMVVTMLGYVVLGELTKRLGNAGTSLLGCAFGIAGNMIRFVLKDGSLVFYSVGVVIGMFGTSLVAGTIVLCIMDSQVYGEWKTGTRSDGLAMSGFGLSAKIGIALGGALAGYLQAIMGYDAALGAPSEAVKTLFFCENTLCVAIGYVLSGICAFLVLRYERKIPQMRAEIEARKAQTA